MALHRTLTLYAPYSSLIAADCILRDQLFTVRQTVSALSQGTTLEPGSIIMTGTPKGVGFVRKPPIYIKHGDDMRVWIAGGIGTLVNSVVEEGIGAKL